MKRSVLRPAVTVVALSALLTGCGSTANSDVPSPKASTSAPTPASPAPTVSTTPQGVPVVPGAVLKAGTEFQALQDAVMAATQTSPCGPGEQRFVISANANEQSAIAASACGFPDSEYGPSRFTVLTTDNGAVQTVLEEGNEFQQVNGAEFIWTDAGWTTDGYVGDTPSVVVIARDGAGPWKATVTAKAD